jgi:hypothetical protein
LDGFRKVLFDHLDEEVRQRLLNSPCHRSLIRRQVYDLRAENLQKYYTLQEVNRLPMYARHVRWDNIADEVPR